jgi:hypothetical protein
MRKSLTSALAISVAIVWNGGVTAQAQSPEQKIWTLLDDSKAAYVSLVLLHHRIRRIFLVKLRAQ